MNELSRLEDEYMIEFNYFQNAMEEKNLFGITYHGIRLWYYLIRYKISGGEL